MLEGLPGQQPADVWAFGTCLWELLTWRLPFEEHNPFQVSVRVYAWGGSSS